MHGGYLTAVYSVYLAASIGLTIWLARTLFHNGAVFLEDVFGDRPAMARAVNRLLVTGFYMLNLGYALLILRADAPHNTVAAIETLAGKLGLLLVSLAVLHFTNLLVFQRLRRRAAAADVPPVAPQMWHPAYPAGSTPPAPPQ